MSKALDVCIARTPDRQYFIDKSASLIVRKNLTCQVQ